MVELIRSDDALKMILSFSGSPQLSELSYQLGDISSVKKLEIDCSIDYVEIESELIIDYCNRIVTKLAPQLEKLVFGFSIRGYETEISEESDDTQRAIVVAARDRWMRDLALLIDSFQHLSKLEHLSFILSVDEDTYRSFYCNVEDSEFLYIYEPEFIFQLLELENIKATLKSLSLNFEHADFVSETMMNQFFTWLNDDNTLMKNLSICSVDGFYLDYCPSDACYVENLTLEYEDCLLDNEMIESAVKPLEKFLKLSILNLNINGETKLISEDRYAEALHSIASTLRRRKGLNLNLSGNFSEKDSLLLGKRSIFHEAIEGKADDEDAHPARKRMLWGNY